MKLSIAATSRFGHVYARFQGNFATQDCYLRGHPTGTDAYTPEEVSAQLDGPVKTRFGALYIFLLRSASRLVFMWSLLFHSRESERLAHTAFHELPQSNR